jgi:hypothetical protein
LLEDGEHSIYEADVELAQLPSRLSGSFLRNSGASASSITSTQPPAPHSALSKAAKRKNRPPPISTDQARFESAHLLAYAESEESEEGGGEGSEDSLESQQDEHAGDEGMPSKKRTKSKARNSVVGGHPAAPGSADSRASLNSSQNGHATGAMNSGLVEHRRKHVVLDSPSSASQASHLMSLESFTLDDDPAPHTPMTPGAGDGAGFFELSKSDQRNFLMLVLLYFLQGVPMGLAGGSVPFLLKDNVSYGQIGVFSLSIYPYSMKLLWSPIVDAIWSSRIGRRKSWILPIQTLSAIGMLWLGRNVEKMMVDAGKDGGSGIWSFTGWWFFLVFMCATQDIAVDGWAITVLSPENLAYASTAQTVGLTAGQFLSYTVFLAFNDKSFANRWFRSTPQETGLLSLGGYLTFWGWTYLAVTLGLALLKREDRTTNKDNVMAVYRVMGGILKLKNIQTFIIVHLIAKIGFQANDAVTNLKLLDKGFSKEDLALTVLIDFPFEIALGYYAGQWSTKYPTMHLWCWAFVGRLVAAVFAQFVVMIFPDIGGGGVPTWYLLTVIVEHVFSTFMNTVMFVAVSAFHAKISDPVIGGTYMTLLATVSNLGGTFPRYFVLKFVDIFTVANCEPPSKPPADLKNPTDAITKAFSCALEPDKDRCLKGGGTCNVEWDGFYIVNVLCVLIGVVTFVGYIKPAVFRLQALPLRAWRLAGGR